MILTPYAVQKLVYQLLLSQLTVAEVPKDLVEVRTIDESPSHEADVCFVDLVRTDRLGFINDQFRLAVAFMRAKLGYVVVGPGDKVDCKAEPFSSLVNYLEAREALPKVLGKVDFSLMCDNCVQPGHPTEMCPYTPACARCNGAPHATRHCPKAEEDAISEWSDEPVTANDGIERDIRAGRIPAMSDSKRHRGNKSKRRRDLSFRPESTKSNADQEYKSAMRQQEESTAAGNESEVEEDGYW